jgi:transposase
MLLIHGGRSVRWSVEGKAAPDGLRAWGLRTRGGTARSDTTGGSRAISRRSPRWSRRCALPTGACASCTTFLLRQGRRYPGRAGWTQPYRRWLADLSFPLAPQHIALQEYRDTIDETERRVERLTEQLRQHTPAWRWAPVVEALQALRWVSFVTAVGLLAEIGDIRRFDHPRQLMASLGLVPSEYSSGPSVRRGGITKAGNPHARRLLAEAAWAYQGIPRIGRQML